MAVPVSDNSSTEQLVPSTTSSTSTTTSNASRRGLKFPHALMSHRGGSLEFVENTLPGFRYSANVLKADLLELDAYLTKDGVPVVIHDGLLKRLCGVEGKHVRDYNYDELPPLLIPDALKEKDAVVKDLDSTRIPKLEELLSEFPKYPMQIDVKEGPEELVIKVGSLIRKYEREDLTVWGSFKTNVNRMCRKNFGTSIPLFFSASRFFLSFGLWAVGLFRVFKWMDPWESCLIMPNIRFFMRPGYFKALNSIGISVIVFGIPGGGVNTIEGYEECRKAGANGICSDRPTMLKEWLRDNPLPSVRGGGIKVD
ncbi:Lysophospholipase D gdpd1 [Quaeritorhiza haematococci]|nr:Lysophospholipase D gdpd1 [Quaeritorhiza haematococci]